MKNNDHKKSVALGVFIISFGVLVFFSDYIYSKFIFISKEIAIKNSEITVENEESSIDYYDETSLVEGTNFAVSEDQKVKKVDSYKNVIEIKNLNIKTYVYDDLSHDSLTFGLGRYPDTPKLGEFGNTVVAGHSSNIYDCILNNLKDIRILDSLDVYNENGDKLVYTVTDKYIVNPDALDVLVTENDKIRELTFITCTNSGSQRLIVKCRQFTEEEFISFKNEVQKESEEKLLYINSSMDLFDFKSIFKERNKPINIDRNIQYVGSSFNRISTLRNINVIIKDDLIKKEHTYDRYFNVNVGFQFDVKE